MAYMRSRRLAIPTSRPSATTGTCEKKIRELRDGRGRNCADDRRSHYVVDPSAPRLDVVRKQVVPGASGRHWSRGAGRDDAAKEIALGDDPGQHALVVDDGDSPDLAGVDDFDRTPDVLVFCDRGDWTDHDVLRSRVRSLHQLPILLKRLDGTSSLTSVNPRKRKSQVEAWAAWGLSCDTLPSTS